MALHWTTLLLPIPAALLPLITLTIDLVIRSSLDQAPEVLKVETKPAFWLSTLAVASSLSWVGVVQWIRILALRKGPDRRKETEEEKVGWATWTKQTFWPWGRS